MIDIGRLTAWPLPTTLSSPKFPSHPPNPSPARFHSSSCKLTKYSTIGHWKYVPLLKKKKNKLKKQLLYIVMPLHVKSKENELFFLLALKCFLQEPPESNTFKVQRFPSLFYSDSCGHCQPLVGKLIFCRIFFIEYRTTVGALLFTSEGSCLCVALVCVGEPEHWTEDVCGEQNTSAESVQLWWTWWPTWWICVSMKSVEMNPGFSFCFF